MFETIFALLAACVTIFIAGLLVRKQNETHEKTKELQNEVASNFDNIRNEVAALISEDPAECTLAYLERRVDILDESIRFVRTPTDKRRAKHDKPKSKKYFTDD